jgi:uncharacterized OsmC-like protein
MSQIRTRPTGALATIGADGAAVVTARSGATTRLAYSPSMDGFNPLELLDASLAGCLAISLRIAARNLGLQDRLGEVRVEVVGSKAATPPSRIAQQVCRYHIAGDFTPAERDALIAGAHAVCTIGHSLDGAMEIVDGEALA